MTGTAHRYRVRSRVERFAGPVFRVLTDEVEMPGGGTAHRDYLVHVGAVGIVAVDHDDRVVLVRQYRHALNRELWEVPAGLIDIDGEALPDTARRELAEEVDLTAGRLDLLVDVHSSPGCSNELIRIFLARDLAPVPEAERHERRDEEAGLTVAWFGLDEAVAMALGGEISNGPSLVAVLAAARVRDQGWTGLRRADTAVPGRQLPPVEPAG